MSATLAVLRLEFTGRARLFAVAIVLGLVPFAVAAMPSLRAQRGEVMVTVAMFVAIIYSLALATAFGASTIVGPLVDKRLSFYLAKPIPAASLWFGKFAAAMLTSAAVFAIISIPASLAAPEATPWGVSDGNLSQLALVAMPVLFLVTHALATMIRSRSVRLGADLLLLLAMAGALFLIGRTLFVGGAMVALGLLFAAVAIAVLIVLAIAPVYQLSRGRVDARSSHAAFSNFVWISVFVILAAAASYAAWVASAPLSSIRIFAALAQSDDGGWVLAGGESSRGGYRTGWLVKPSTGEKRRLGAMAPWVSGTISRDGKTAMFTRLVTSDPRQLMSELVLQPTETGGQSAVIPLNGWVGTAVQTADASRVALVLDTTIEVYDTVAGRRIAVASRANRRVQQIGFVNRDLVRLITSNSDLERMTIDEFDLTMRRYRTVGTLPDRVRPTFSPDLSRILLRPRTGPMASPDGRIFVADGRTGAPLFELPPAKDHALLAGGRAAYLTAAGGRSTMHLTEVNGSAWKETAVPADTFQFAGQAGDKLILEARNSILIVDPRNAAVRRIDGAIAARISPAGLNQYDESGFLLGVDARRTLAAWNLATGEKKEL